MYAESLGSRRSNTTASVTSSELSLTNSCWPMQEQASRALHAAGGDSSGARTIAAAGHNVPQTTTALHAGATRRRFHPK
jgi:hypothetical protein